MSSVCFCKQEDKQLHIYMFMLQLVKCRCALLCVLLLCNAGAVAALQLQDTLNQLSLLVTWQCEAMPLHAVILFPPVKIKCHVVCNGL